MGVCRELENKYGLKNTGGKSEELSGPYLKKADYKQGNIKRQVSNILKSTASYRFQTFGEYSTMLSCFNIEAKQVKGEHEGVPYNGIVYSVTDDNGIPVSAPVKSSLIGKKFGYEGLNRRMKRHSQDFKNKKWEPKTRNQIALAMHESDGDSKRFAGLLHKQGIEVVLRKNDGERLYGVTFVDHNSQEVYNGSRLGKQFSANAFNDFFNRENKQETDALLSPQQQTLWDADKETVIEQAFGLFGFEQHGTDSREEAFERRMKKKKKRKKGPSNGML